MRTASLLTILMMIPILFASTTLASPPTNGSTTIVSDSQTWEGGNLNGDVVIANGGVLTWTGESQISTDSTITIEEGGILNLDNAVLTGQSSVPHLLKSYPKVEEVFHGINHRSISSIMELFSLRVLH